MFRIQGEQNVLTRPLPHILLLTFFPVRYTKKHRRSFSSVFFHNQQYIGKSHKNSFTYDYLFWQECFSSSICLRISFSSFFAPPCLVQLPAAGHPMHFTPFFFSLIIHPMAKTRMTIRINIANAVFIMLMLPPYCEDHTLHQILSLICVR